MVMDTFIEVSELPKLKDPILIEGLPGVGYVGRNAAGYLVEELEAKKFGELLSKHFPPVVLLDPNRTGIMRDVMNEFYYYKGKKGEPDLVILIGDAQSIDVPGHYEIVDVILELAEKVGVSKIITIGGYPTGVLEEKKEPKVYGAGIDPAMMKEFEELGVQFKDTDVGQIIGASGLLVTRAWRRAGVPGVCLMGETSGMLLSDPKAAEAVLKILAKYLGVKIDLSRIEQQAKKTDEVISKIEDLQKKLLMGLQAGTEEQKPSSRPGDFGYIG